MHKIVLHQWEISPFCGKVRKMLKRKGLAYETVEYDGLSALRAAKLSGVGKLPVLDCDGSRIQDSSDIAAFLELRYPEPALYPASAAPHRRFRCRGTPPRTVQGRGPAATSPHPSLLPQTGVADDG